MGYHEEWKHALYCLEWNSEEWSLERQILAPSDLKL